MKPDPAKLKQLGRWISSTYPVRNDTPPDMLKLLEKLG
jgi:hypothetical protein